MPYGAEARAFAGFPALGTQPPGEAEFAAADALMTGFWIGFRPPEPSRHGPTRRGRVRLGSFEETFEALTNYWSPGDYQRHWQRSIQRIVAGTTPSCLITSLPDPAVANFIEWWPLYRHHDSVMVQNQMLFADQLDAPFDPQDPYRFVGARSTRSPEGTPISEWRVPVDALRAFLEGMPDLP